MTELTQKQENFCLNIVEGLTQRESWVKAGYSGSYAPALIDIHACNMAGKDKVKIRIAEIREEIKDKLVSKAIATAEERRERLTVFIREDNWLKPGIKNRGSNLTAIDTLNKMDKLYADEAKTVYNDIKIIVVREPLLKELKDGQDSSSQD